MQRRTRVLASLAAVVIATTVAGPASGATGFDNERPAGYDINPKHQSTGSQRSPSTRITQIASIS